MPAKKGPKRKGKAFVGNLDTPSTAHSVVCEFICEQLSEGKTLPEICAIEGVPSIGTVLRWTSQDDTFRIAYEKAMEIRAQVLFEHMFKIADGQDEDGFEVYESYDPETGKTTVEKRRSIQRDRLRTDTRKWALSKMYAKKYADKIQQEVSGPNGAPVETKTILDLSHLSQEERDILRNAIEGAMSDDDT